jgi:hypothetical protein
MSKQAFTSISIDSLTKVSGGQGAMPRSEVRRWLRACANEAYAAGSTAQATGNAPRTALESEDAAITACNAGVGNLLGNK